MQDFSLDHAKALDAADPLSELRTRFELPVRADGSPQAYFAGNSLGALPHSARDALERVVTKWSRQAVAGHFHGEGSW